jgi:uncharacterized protein (TIGR02466 family)
MKIHNFFPLSIFQDQIQMNIDEKNNLINEIRKMKNLSKNSDYKLKNESWTGDTQGFEYLHKNKTFDKLFEEIKKKITLYLDFLKVNHEQLDFFLSRSWATISNNKEAIARHEHLQSHISYAYYLKKSPEDANFILHDEIKRNEFIPALFTSKTLQKEKVVIEPTYASAPRVNLEVKEDDIVIFPSKTPHGTDQALNNNERISISGDVIFLAKDSSLLEHLTPSFDNWKKL